MNTVTSKDGTKIAYLKNGAGPAVILVDGAFCSKDFGPMPKIVPLLSANFTVITYDRRARGESGDTRPYTIEREIEDIEALIRVAGGKAFLFGISSGAILAFLAVAQGLNVPKLALFEPPFVGNAGSKRSADAVQQLDKLIAENKRSEAVKFYFKKVMDVPAFIPFILQFTPNWKKMKANAKSLSYDATICGDYLVPKDKAALITIPTVVIDSIKSPKSLRTAVEEVANALPNAKRITLKGTVHDVPAKILMPCLEEFYKNLE